MIDKSVLHTTEKPMSMNPKKFILWLFMITIIMIFAAFTSAYLVRREAGNWLIIELPTIFYFSTAIILLSSVTLHIAYLAAKQDKIEKLKLFIFITSILGFGFMVTQFIGCFGTLVDMGVYFAGKDSNPAGSFIYVLTGVHVAHLVAGVVFLFVVLFNSFNSKINSKNLTQMEMCVTFWHFLDLLWVYLFVFLLLFK